MCSRNNTSKQRNCRSHELIPANSGAYGGSQIHFYPTPLANRSKSQPENVVLIETKLKRSDYQFSRALRKPASEDRRRQNRRPSLIKDVPEEIENDMANGSVADRLILIEAHKLYEKDRIEESYSLVRSALKNSNLKDPYWFPQLKFIGIVGADRDEVETLRRVLVSHVERLRNEGKTDEAEQFVAWVCSVIDKCRKCANKKFEEIEGAESQKGQTAM